MKMVSPALGFPISFNAAYAVRPAKFMIQREKMDANVRVNSKSASLFSTFFFNKILINEGKQK